MKQYLYIGMPLWLVAVCLIALVIFGYHFIKIDCDFEIIIPFINSHMIHRNRKGA